MCMHYVSVRAYGGQKVAADALELSVEPPVSCRTEPKFMLLTTGPPC